METAPTIALGLRLAELERALRRTRRLAGATSLALLAALALGLRAPRLQSDDVLRVRTLEVVDERGVVRVRLGQDAEDSQRRSRAAGITLHDGSGSERGGFSTMDDGSVVLAMDAPAGVGAPMRDRIGILVGPEGSASVLLIDNQTRGVVQLASDGEGGGGLRLFDWDLEARQVRVKTQAFDGDSVETHELGQ